MAPATRTCTTCTRAAARRVPTGRMGACSAGVSGGSSEATAMRSSPWMCLGSRMWSTSPSNRHTRRHRRRRTSRVLGLELQASELAHRCGAHRAATAVDGVAGASRVAAGWWHSCAALTDGHVVCWGDNEHGQLGDGTTELRSGAVLVDGIDDATDLTAGGMYTCALRARGARGVGVRSPEETFCGAGAFRLPRHRFCVTGPPRSPPKRAPTRAQSSLDAARSTAGDSRASARTSRSEAGGRSESQERRVRSRSRRPTTRPARSSMAAKSVAGATARTGSWAATPTSTMDRPPWSRSMTQCESRMARITAARCARRATSRAGDGARVAGSAMAALRDTTSPARSPVSTTAFASPQASGTRARFAAPDR